MSDVEPGKGNGSGNGAGGGDFDDDLGGDLDGDFGGDFGDNLDLGGFGAPMQMPSAPMASEPLIPEPPKPPPPVDEAVGVADVFVDAIVWGDHNKVWALIGNDGRAEVLEVATKRGMDEGLAARLQSDTGSPAETNEFLADLVNGLRSELAGNDLDHITFELEPDESRGDRAAVKMLVPLHPLLGGTLPIGTVYMGAEDGAWRVERLIPLTSK